MRPTSNLYLTPGQWGSAFMRVLASWWHMIHFGAIALVIALSPSTYNRANRGATSRYIYTSTWQVLPWFTLLSALVSLVLIRIVVVTALSYGLSQYALEMVVRVLVLELIPLAAALFVALRSGLAFNAGTALTSTTALAPHGPDLDLMRRDLVPQVIASSFAVLSMAMVSSVIVLVLAYINVYGVSPWGLAGYTRTVGRVFEPAVSIGFALKTLLFGLAVAIIPMAAMLEPSRLARMSPSTVQPGAIRLLSALILIEAGSLTLKYI